MMARTGFCDSRPLLDPCKKNSTQTEENRVPLRTWANTCAVKARRAYNEGEGLRSGQQHKAENKDERRWIQRLPLSADGIMDYAQKKGSTPSVDGYKEEAVLNHLHRVQVLPTLRQLVPGLLQREIEVAMDKLGLLFDRTYAWDVFSDMMEVFSFSEETLYLAVHLLNRALCQIEVSISSLQLLGVVCLFLAAKKEECLLPEVSELCYLMAHTYTKKQLLRMERRVLSGLRFELSHCPPIHFLLLSAYIARCSDKVICMARYLLELSLLEGQCVLYLPTHLAGAALHLARRLLQEAATPEGEAAWCIASNIHLGSEATLFNIMQIMAIAAAKAHMRETRATYIKFSTVETLHVSMHPALKNAPCLLGLPCFQI
ncbi:cyclin-P isoform X3 [Brachyhypopomus gauderio]|uniref:cyclin-P isoform X3 n=1 Tax=Brachyhypopomus gauderio TaxID=698409 RepID=UPI0040420BE5